MDRVYYANYLVICERARTEFLREAGFPYREIEAGGCFFPVRQCHIRYYGYAVYDDLLTCRSFVSRLRHATLAIDTEIYRPPGEKPIVVASVELAAVDHTGKPILIASDLRNAITPYLREASGG
jgi:acyl-CoA thioester hydrolase